MCSPQTYPHPSSRRRRGIMLSSIFFDILHPPSPATLKSPLLLLQQQQQQQQQSSHKRLPGFFQCSAAPQPTHHHTNSGAALLFLEVGISEKESNAVLEKLNPEKGLSDLIQALENLGVKGPVLSRLIQTRPHVLTSPHIHSLLSFLSRDLKLSGVVIHLERLLLSAATATATATDTTFLSGFEAKVRLLLDHGIPVNRLSHVLNNLNLTKALCFKSFQDIEKMLSFLKPFGGADLILGRPAILNCDLDSQLLPRIEFLLNLSGGDEAATTAVLLKLPFILAYSVDHYTSHVDFFRSFAGLTDQQIFKIILVYPSLFSASRTRKLQPRIEFLKQCGFGSNDIYKFLIKAPLFLSLSFEHNLAHKLVLLLKIGYEHGTKELGLAMGWVCRSSCKNMQEVVSLLLNYGLTCEEILAMGKKHPQLLQYNHKSMKQKLDYLTEEMGCEVRELLAFPAFLGYGFDGRIKYRFESSGKNSGEGMSINKLFSMSTARFSKKQQKKLPART